MDSVDGNMGAAITIKYPACFLMGELFAISEYIHRFAGPGQQQDTGGAKMVHVAPYVLSIVMEVNISRRWRVYKWPRPGQRPCASSQSQTYWRRLPSTRFQPHPYVDVRTDDVEMGHEAVTKVSADQALR